MRTCLLIAAMLAAALLSPHLIVAQATRASDDPLQHGHALLIGNAHYKDRGWAQLDDIPLQLDALRRGLELHFDNIQVVSNIEAEQLWQTINSFVRTYGNDSNARLFLYYAGHGYTEVIGQRNENRGYITGIDTPKVDFTRQGYDAARLRAISMAEIRALLDDVLAKHILFVFDSCFAGTIFTNRGQSNPPGPLTADVVARLLEQPARDFITAGRANETVPAHSPIPELFLAALNGAADPYKHGVIMTTDIYQYLFDQIARIPDFKLTPQVGKLPTPAFAEGTFLFRVINPAIRAPDESETARLYKLAADQGHARAQDHLGFFYANGRGGLPKDDREAARLYKLAADQGHARAQDHLGFFYANGRGGLPKDDREAARLYKLAADQGDARAQVHLGFFYANGRGGLPKDDREAAHFYKLAADQGDADAISALRRLALP